MHRFWCWVKLPLFLYREESRLYYESSVYSVLLFGSLIIFLWLNLYFLYSGFHLVGGAGGSFPPKREGKIGGGREGGREGGGRERGRERKREREGYYTQHYLDTVFCYM